MRTATTDVEKRPNVGTPNHDLYDSLSILIYRSTIRCHLGVLYGAKGFDGVGGGAACRAGREQHTERRPSTCRVTIMAAGVERDAFTLGAGIKDTHATSGIHPRLLSRINFVLFTGWQDILLAQLDRLIDSLDHISPPTDRFSILAKTTRGLRGQMGNATVANPDCLFLLDQVKQHIADLRALGL
jgi:hypothetical protein